MHTDLRPTICFRGSLQRIAPSPALGGVLGEKGRHATVDGVVDADVDLAADRRGAAAIADDRSSNRLGPSFARGETRR
jgi:hypothetical protein